MNNIKNWLSYEQASQWAHDNHITTAKQWFASKHVRPSNIPSNPHSVYSQWSERGGWSGFLTGVLPNPPKSWASYEQSSQWAQDNNITTYQQWMETASLRSKAYPVSPREFYKQVWKAKGGSNGFFGTTKLRGASIVERLMRLVLDEIFDPLAEPHRLQNAQGQTKNHSVDACYDSVRLIVEYDGAYFHKNKVQKDLEKTTDLVNNNWNVVRVRENKLDLLDKVWDVHVGADDTFNTKTQKVLSHLLKLHELKKLTLTVEKKRRILELMDNMQILKILEKCKNYQNFCSYEDAQQWVQDNNITSQTQYKNTPRPDYIPSNPNREYADVFTKRGGWGGFLQNGNISYKNHVWATFEEASQWAQDNGIKSETQWVKNPQKRPANIPSNPQQVYADFTAKGGWPGFLNNGGVHAKNRQWATFEQAQQWAQHNNITMRVLWRKSIRPHNIPLHPDRVYLDFEQRGGWDALLGQSLGPKIIQRRTHSQSSLGNENQKSFVERPSQK